MVKVLPHVMRNINEFNIPAEDTHAYEILYFGVNLILMFEYRLSFDIEVIKDSDGSSNKIEVIIISRKDVPAWKEGNHSGSNTDIKFHLSNKTSPVSNNSKTKTVEVTLIHTWQQEIKESQLKDM